ncbi:MAG: flagellar basal body rod protein FlgB [Alteromonadaceae bacterium]|nr:flagellar basal body rod protein FlgB [Alteromonadaceae bacterium]
MAISFDKAFGLHPQGLIVRAKRAEIIAGNIANADTPGYKAVGMDFQKALEQASHKQQSGMTRTNSKHFDIRSEINHGIGFRTPNQPDTGDGNTVDVQVERNLYLQNSLEYQASLQFLTGKIQALKKAITGGQ